MIHVETMGEKEEGTTRRDMSSKGRTLTNTPSLLMLNRVFLFPMDVKAMQQSEPLHYALLNSGNVGILALSLPVLKAIMSYSGMKGYKGALGFLKNTELGCFRARRTRKGFLGYGVD